MIPTSSRIDSIDLEGSHVIGKIKDRASFIAGSPRSGTTLMTALLDDHPELLVFPEEYLYVQPRKTPRESARRVLDAVFKEKVLLRLKGKKSFLNDILSEDRKYDNLDYHRFEDAVNEYFRLLLENKEETVRISVTTLAFISLICGYGHATGKETYSRWVVKHPHYELHWQQLFNDFPDAKIIYMVRDPRDVILSRTLKRNKKRYLKRGGNAGTWNSEKGSLRPSARFLKEWERSIIAFLGINEAVSGQILPVRYEDLVSAPRDIMGKVSKFLGVPWQESLVTPSFFGKPWKGNSMQEQTFHGVSSLDGRKKHKLPPHHLWQIEAWLDDVMVRQPGAYVPLQVPEGIDVKALVSWLRGEGVIDFWRNRLRMLANERNLTGRMGFNRFKNSPGAKTTRRPPASVFFNPRSEDESPCNDLSCLRWQSRRRAAAPAESGLVRRHMKKIARSPVCEAHFGGPDMPAYRLRDLLAERIAAVPPGGAIDWVTYYFRDQRLAEELLRAHLRGVKVTVTLERHPRTAHANDAVIAMLSGPNGLGAGFRTLSLLRAPTPPGTVWKPHLHEKLYCFSQPSPIAFIGSFNPSGDDPENDPAIISEIGDQDRGYNALVGLGDPLLVERLVEHARWIHRVQCPVFHRFSAIANRTVKGEDTDIHFWPRVRSHPAVQFLLRLGSGARIRIAASHIKGSPVVRSIIRLAHNGAAVEILAEPTLRRVPVAAEESLTQAGIPFQRVTHAEGLPMHNKFVLAEKEGQRWVMFGSFNWTMRSYWLNHEIGAISANRHLFNAFAERWEVMHELTNL
jgi:hypothetical protein